MCRLIPPLHYNLHTQQKGFYGRSLRKLESLFWSPDSKRRVFLLTNPDSVLGAS